MRAKVSAYLDAGVRLLWVLCPEVLTVVAHTPGGDRALGDDDMLDGGDVVPGFACPVRALWG